MKQMPMTYSALFGATGLGEIEVDGLGEGACTRVGLGLP